MLLSLQIPPGVFANGTALQASGRWNNASLVRWEEGVMKPIGGWQDRTDESNRPAARPSGMFGWRTNGGDRWLAIGTYEALYVFNIDGVMTNITPGTFTDGDEIAVPKIGYGYGTFGSGFYGVARPDVDVYSEATSWSFDNWGENLVACSSADGRLLEWDLDVLSDAAAISGAPTSCRGLVVTEGRFLFALGAGGNPRKVQWSDREDNTTWTPTATNEAGDFELQTEGQIMTACRVRGQILILTDRDAHTATETGDLLVFGFERAGSACGIISRRALVPADNGAFWMSRNGFFRFNSGIAAEVPCEVSDYVFSDISKAQESQIFGVSNGQFNEVWWFYPSDASSTCDRYVCYNYLEQHWTIGALDRSAGIDRGVFSNPIWASSGGVIYDHESGLNTEGETPFAESAPVQIEIGEQTFTALDLLPDEKTQGQVTVKFKASFYPNETEVEYGPYTMSNPTNLRFTGRQMRLRVEGEDNQNWRWGVPRVRVEARGRR